MAKNKIFLDTNIIIDILSNRVHCASAATVLHLGVTGEIGLYITNLTVANVLYITRKELGKENALLKMRELCRIVNIAPCGQEENNRAFSIPNPDFEDALQFASAETIKADVILTRNEKHFRYSSIPVMDCETFLSNY